jgi:hypothetical protein
MMMMKTVIVGVVALLVGSLAGAMIAQHRGNVRLASLTQDLDKARAEAQKSADSKDAAEAQADFLEAENASLKQEVAKRGTSSDSAPAALVEEETVASSTAEETATEGAEEERRRGRDGGGFWRGGGDMTPEERTERETRFRDFMQQRRDERDAAFQEQVDAAPDAETKERLLAMQDYRASMSELRDAMRNAETDEERDELREMMMANAETLRDMTITQAEQMVRDVATDFGIKGEEKQKEFMEALRELQTSPVLEPGFGSGRGGGGPGRGGPRF